MHCTNLNNLSIPSVRNEIFGESAYRLAKRKAVRCYCWPERLTSTPAQKSSEAKELHKIFQEFL